jgi:hypothetical protein
MTSIFRPLLRRPNKCNVTVSEQLLKQSGRYQELVMLYKNRGLHRRALELMYVCNLSPPSVFAFGVARASSLSFFHKPSFDSSSSQHYEQAQQQ